MNVLHCFFLQVFMVDVSSNEVIALEMFVIRIMSQSSISLAFLSDESVSLPCTDRWAEMAGTWLESAHYICFSQHAASDRCSMVVGILVSGENPLTLKSPAQSWFRATLLAVPSGHRWSVNVRAATVPQSVTSPLWSFYLFVFGGGGCLACLVIQSFKLLTFGKWNERSWGI